MTQSAAPWSPFEAPPLLEMAFLSEQDAVDAILQSRLGQRAYLENIQNTPVDFRGSVGEVKEGAIYPLMWLQSDQQPGNFGNEPLPSNPDQPAIRVRVTGRLNDKITFDVLLASGTVVGRLNATVAGVWSNLYTGAYVPYTVQVGGLKLTIGTFTPVGAGGDPLWGPNAPPLPVPAKADCANECASRGGCMMILNTASVKNPKQQVTTIICNNNDLLESPTGQPPFTWVTNISGLEKIGG